ncbi:MAG: 4-alpha-glucanotransferase [Verrucomicrobia bacterium]|nr:MAG: 4-alpha-glucanotransferase [Verrucomicrobiota bacterium]
MQLVFRVNYCSVPGQSLWLKLAAFFTASGACIEQVLPLRWLNARQWEVAVELHGNGPLRLSYHYQLRQDGNGLQLDEWLAPRLIELDPAARDGVNLLDTWRSAGTPDYALETKPFAVLLPQRGPFYPPAPTPAATMEFVLRMAALPPGQVPCLLGSVRELGDWDEQLALPLEEIAANLWRVAIRLPAAGHIEYKYGLCEVASGRLLSLEEGPNRCLASQARGPRQWTRVSDEGYARKPKEMFRGCGVAVPVFSLRSERGLGVGEFADLSALADWAAATGLRMIQILPVNDTTAADDWTDSYPYSAISGFALHPLYLRIDDLPYPMPPDFAAQLAAARLQLNALPAVDYEAVMRVKRHLTRQVYQKHQAALLADARIDQFLKLNREWLIPYAVFCLLRERHHSADFSRWGEWSTYDRERVEALANKSAATWPEVFYHIWLQCELDRQLTAAVCHLHANGIVLKGDLPIGIDRHSVEAWSLPHLFKMTTQAGAPPDAFAAKGQNWGFPTYDWEAMHRDHYAWWRARFAQLGRYFDAYRIDHILGFFRIWQIPLDQVEGVMGWFEPALPVTLDELQARGIAWDFCRFCRPYIREHSLAGRFGTEVDWVKDQYLEPCGYDYWRLKQAVATQRQIVECFREATAPAAPQRVRYAWIRDALMDCASEVLLFEVPGSGGRLFHPRCQMRSTRSYQELDDDVKWRLDELYDDYFHRRQEDFWQACGYQKLPVLRLATSMLLCGEDLGMVPACVPGVLAELGLLSLEIQRMPKTRHTGFSHPADAPYLSVVSPSTHDMPTLREWWRDDGQLTGQFAWSMLGVDFPSLNLSGDTAASILALHLHSPAMWALLPLQDLLAMDESIRHPEPAAERINVPANMPHYWRYRMFLGLEQLAAARPFNARLHTMVTAAGR